MCKMKRFLLILCLIGAVFALVACADRPGNGTVTSGRTLCSASLSVYGNEISGSVSSDTDRFFFAEDISVAESITEFKVSYDKNGEHLLSDKTATLYKGDNTFYIHLYASGKKTDTYTVSIYRKSAYTVSFAGVEGEAYASQKIEEGDLVAQPAQPQRDGYTFLSWDFDFSTPITENVTITAQWSACDAQYKVQYYLWRWEEGFFELVEEQTHTAKVGTKVYAEEKTFENYELRQPQSGVVKADGSLVLPMYYDGATRNIKLILSDERASAVCAFRATHGSQETASAPFANNPAIASFDGYYINGELVCADSTYTFTVLGDITIELRFEIKSEMDPFDFTLLDEYCMIRGLKDKTIEHLVIPECVEIIGPGAFTGNQTLKSVHIASKVTKITANAFKNCRNIKTVTFAQDSKLETVGDSAFYGCERLEAIELPYGVTRIWDEAFYNCRALRYVVLPNSLQGINEYAFAGCINLAEIDIPESITSMGVAVFSGCGLKDVVVPGNIVRIPLFTFSSCKQLRSVTIADGVEVLGEKAFYGCSALIDVTLASSVREISTCCFEYCTALPVIVFPEGVQKVHPRALAYCYNLVSITIPSTLESIDIACGSHKLVEIINGSSLTISESVLASAAYYGTATHYTESRIVNQDGYLFYTDDSDKTYLVAYVGKDIALTLPASCAGKSYEIYPYAFSRQDTIASIAIPEGVERIGEYAFSYVYNLSSITVPATVTDIGEYAFVSCKQLVEVINRSALPIEKESEAYGGIALYAKEVHSEESKIQNKDEYLFYTAQDGTLYLVGYTGNQKHLTLPFYGTPYTIGAYAFYNRSGIESVTIPDGITCIGEQAFGKCIGLLSVFVGASVETIEYAAFEDCTRLKYVEFAKNSELTHIKGSAFSGCVSISNISLPEKLTIIDTFAFNGCEALGNIVMHASMRSIEMYAFDDCGPLYIYFVGTQLQWRQVAVTHEGNNAVFNARLQYDYVPET